MSLEIKDCKAWVEHGQVFMSIIYIEQEGDKIIKYTFPKILLPFTGDPLFHTEFYRQTLTLESCIKLADCKEVGDMEGFIGTVCSDDNGKFLYKEKL